MPTKLKGNDHWPTHPRRCISHTSLWRPCQNSSRRTSHLLGHHRIYNLHQSFTNVAMHVPHPWIPTTTTQAQGSGPFISFHLERTAGQASSGRVGTLQWQYTYMRRIWVLAPPMHRTAHTEFVFLVPNNLHAHACRPSTGSTQCDTRLRHHHALASRRIARGWLQ